MFDEEKEMQAIRSHVLEKWMLPREASPYDWELSLFHAYGELCEAVRQKQPVRMIEIADKFFTLCWGYCHILTWDDDKEMFHQMLKDEQLDEIINPKRFLLGLGENLARAAVGRNWYATYPLLIWTWFWIKLGLPELVKAYSGNR